MKGLVISGNNNFFTVETDDNRLLRCSIKGKKLKESAGFYNPLAPGDHVIVEQDMLNADQGRIVALIPRTNSFSRWNQKAESPQILACNVDAVVCVTSPANPPFRPRFVDRVAVQAAHAGIPLIIAVNKIDRGIDSDISVRLEHWRKIGITVCEVSAQTGEGIDTFAALLEHKTVLVTGQSGVGKSSLLNRLDPRLQLKTAAVSYKYDRGIHTTTQGVLLHISYMSSTGIQQQLSVIDSPGIRRFGVWDIEADKLAFYFPEMADRVLHCAFGLSCTHTQEAGCKIREGVQQGSIHPDRYESWRLIREEIAQAALF